MYSSSSIMKNQWLYNMMYNSGDVFLPKKIKQMLEIDLVGSSKKTFYISGWSVIHLISGILLGYFYLHFRWDTKMYIYNMFLIHSTWELWQIFIGMSKPYKLTGYSNLIDTIMDTIFFMLGVYVVRKYYTI